MFYYRTVTSANGDGEIQEYDGEKHQWTPGLAVSPIPINSGLTNQNTHFAYPDGSIHVVMIHKKKESSRRVYHHHWRTSASVWKSEVPPFTGKRPKVVGLKDRTLILAYATKGQLNLAAGKPLSNNSGWKWTELEIPAPLPSFSDALLDVKLVTLSNVLPFYTQDEPTKIIRTKNPKPVGGLPVPLRVIDYRIK